MDDAAYYIMAELFGVKISAISKHLKNIYSSQELSQEATISKMEIVQIEGGENCISDVIASYPQVLVQFPQCLVMILSVQRVMILK